VLLPVAFHLGTHDACTQPEAMHPPGAPHG
jgi:hypothetical protein